MESVEIKTFIFVDTETTSLPHLENNETRITEICLTAVHSDHLKMKRLPRVQHKLLLCLNPNKRIDPQSTHMTGLSNELLENIIVLDDTSFRILHQFLNVFETPVCFVAHNGNYFDYPILKAELQRIGQTFDDNILCVDSLLLFREIHNKNEKVLEEGNKVNVKGRKRKAGLSFKLSDVYKRLTSKKPIVAHTAEYDVTMLIECAVVLGEDFIDLANRSFKKLVDIPTMVPGKPIGKC